MLPRYRVPRLFLEVEPEPARVFLEPELHQPQTSRQHQFLEAEAPVSLVQHSRLRTNLFLVHPLSSRHQVKKQVCLFTQGIRSKWSSSVGKHGMFI